jgi:hypothetical protein
LTDNSTPRLRDALEPWCAAGLSGAVRILDPPGGAVFLVNGRVAYAECPLVCGVDRRLTISGRLPAEVWRAALAAGRATRQVGADLVHNEHVTAGELELVTMLALFDAALFLFDTDAATQFEPGTGHVLGTVRTFALAEVCREVDRRRRLLTDAWSEPSIDTAAVVPARRLAGQHVALSALQWEIVANADRRRSPVDLARLLGRDTFATLLEVRRLAQAGLVEPGRPGGSAVAESAAAMRARASAAPLPTSIVASLSVGGADPGVPREKPPPAADLPPLPRRQPGRAPVPPADGPIPAANFPESTLLRIRQALEALT